MSIKIGDKGEIIKTCKEFNVKELYAFGSILTEDFSSKSDVDLLVIFKRNYASDAFNHYFGLKEKLENIFGRNVDLVCYNAIKNPYFKREIDNTKSELYAA